MLRSVLINLGFFIPRTHQLKARLKGLWETLVFESSGKNILSYTTRRHKNNTMREPGLPDDKEPVILSLG
jgi:hypothetical protein